MLLSCESRARAAVLDDVVESFDHLIAVPEVAKVLGASVVELTTLVHGLYVPNAALGVLRIPRSRLETNDTPCLPLLPGSSVVPGKNMFSHNPIQKEQLAMSEEGDQLEQISAMRFAEISNQAHNLRLIPGDVARVESSFTDFTGYVPGILATRPVVMINRKAIAEASPLDRGVVVLHEAIHLTQVHKTPFERHYLCDDSLTKSEMGAYAGAAAAYRAISIDEHTAECTDLQDFTLRMDTIRLNHCDPEAPMEPTRTITRRYIQEGAVTLSHPSPSSADAVLIS